MVGASLHAMAGARHFSQLIVWQIADALRIEVLKLTQSGACSSNWKFRQQVEDAIDSVCRNIAEGFAADTHGQFAWFLRVSRRSLNELRDALRSALLKRYTTPADLSAAFDLIRRLYPALNNFIAYLELTPNTPQGRHSADPSHRVREEPTKRTRSDGTGSEPPDNTGTDPEKPPRTDKR